MYDGDESEGPKGTFEIYKAEADTLFKQGEYRKSIESYTTALELQPGDKNCLVSRSKCYLQLGDTDNALTDAESSLQDDKNFHKGVYQKAQALYYQGDFELSLVYYHRGHKLRPELQEFRLGIQKAQEAIDNSVGSPDKVQLTTEGDLSFFEKQDDKKPKKRQGYGSYGRGAGPAQSKALDTRRPEGNEKTIKQLLGELYGDRQYLEKLLKETDQQTDMGKSISSLVSQGLSYLDTRTDFWRQQKPMYARKHDRAQQRRKTEMVGGKLSANDYIIKELERIDQAQIEGKYQESLKRAQRCLGTVQTFSEDAVPNKMEVIANLYSCIGNAHLELGNYDKSLENHQIDYDMGEQYDMEEACSRGLDNLGRVHARKGDYSQAIEVWEKKLPLSKSALESTWLYHEVGRCYLEMEQYQKAKDYGEKSLIAAEEAEDTQWQLQASVLVAQSEVKLGDLSAALSSFETSLDLAKTLGDTSAETAIKKAIDDVNTKIAKGGGSSTSINKESASTKEKEEANVDDSNNAESSDITEEEEEKGEGTVKPYPNFNAKNDAEVIKNAMSGLGTEEEDITNVLAFRTLSQRQEIAAAYKSEYGKDMLDEIEGETSGDYAETIKGLLMSPREFDAHQLRSAMKGAGTDEDILFEIICTRSNAELKEIKKIYKQNYKAELVDHIVSETSKDTKHLLVSLANCNRSDSREVDNNLAKKDAKALHDAAHKSRGTDEATITTLLVSRSFPQLRATFNEYKKLSGKDIEDMLEYELSGDLLTGTKTVVNCVRNKRSHFAKQLQKVTKGIGTDDKTLIRVIVSRCEKDLVQVKDEYKKVSGTTLESTIESETSGSYKDMLTKLVSQGQPPDMSAKKKD